MLDSAFDRVYEKLLAHYGPPQEPPGESPWERLVAVVLTQRATPAAVAAALDNLREADVHNPYSLLEVDSEELAELLQPAGAARQAAGRLQKLARWIIENHGGDVAEALSLDAETLRAELAAINGIGRATADALLLHAARKPAFVVDRAAHRVLKRHGWFDFDADDDELKMAIEAGLGHDPSRLKQLHLLIARAGRDYCGSRPRCDACPLAELLPDGGPREPNA
ncbi:MAG TPA: endonuclease III domain-containing protein [Pirellulales bacterium]|nr:endonuclease III domain-containing protein [Pirellulales bacterium]